MKSLLSFFCFVVILCFTANSQVCTDPDTTFITDCGTHIDLCMDEYTTEMGVGILLNITANDDLGILDPWDCDTLCGTCNGSLYRQTDGRWFYMPDPGFCGCDSFLYVLNWNDTCAAGQCYCEPGCPDGRIWTVNSMYMDPDPGDVVVLSKNDDTMAVFYGLEQYEMFFVDGSSYHHSNTNWLYKLYQNGQYTNKVTIHTSCSQEIFGLTFDFVKPISGCVAHPHDGPLCEGLGNNSSDGPISRYDPTPITVQGSDTTLVFIEVEAPLAIIDYNFNLQLVQNEVVIWGTLNKVIGIEKMEVQRATTTEDFLTIVQFNKLNIKANWRIIDPFPPEGDVYYRLKITESDGNIVYSDIKTINTPLQQSWIKIQPNPGKGNFQVLSNTSKMLINWNILDLNGRILHKTTDFYDLDVFRRVINELSNGLYLIKISDHQGQTIVEKLTVL